MIYRKLADMYGWTAVQVSKMTHDQQMMYLRKRQDDADPVQHFSSLDDLDQWMQRRARQTPDG